MKIETACSDILNQLSNLVNQISEKDYSKPVSSLNGSTIGQHIRHTVEFFMCLKQGVKIGSINYDKRAHDKQIETDKFSAMSALSQIHEFLNEMVYNPQLILEVSYNLNNDKGIAVNTNYYRELIYNIEHAVHHMAIIKIGIKEVAPYISLPHEFGVAASTIRYQETVAAAR